MYCSACGAECKKEDAFCGECGAKLEKKEENKSQKIEKTNIKETRTKEKNTITKKNKVMIVSILIALVLLFGGYQVGRHIYSPKTVADRYIKAIQNGDADALYKYLGIEENDHTFVTKKIFKELTDDETKSKTIENYKITDVTYSSGNLSATVSFKYTSKGSASESTGQVYLTKKSKKNLFIFDNWKVSNSNETTVVKDFILKVPTGSKVTYAGVNVEDKYLEKNKDDSKIEASYDVYVLPQVFAVKTKVTAILSNGIMIEEDVTPSNYHTNATLTLSRDNVSNEVQKNLNVSAKEILTTIYNAAIEKKSFEEIKKNFENKDVDLEKLEKSYQEFVSSLSSESNQLTKIEFQDSSIYSLGMDGENLKIRFKLKYDYTVKYNSYFSNEEQTHNDSANSYITLILGIKENSYYLVDFENIVTYFSRY